ncbi:MAG: sulfatase [Bacteriovorax sp.]|nr:sulfatase [Bacteriovorax sp.]
MKFIVLLFLTLVLFSCNNEKRILAKDKSIFDLCSKKCNVILISIDSLRRDHLGAYGYPRNTSPNIDSFAKDSWLFKNYFSTDYLTPVSERSVHTGLFPDRNYTKEFKKTPPQTLGDILNSNGYTSAAIGNSPEFQMVVEYRELFKKAFGNHFHIPKTRMWNNRQFNWNIINDFVNKNKDHPLFLWFPLGSVHAPFGYKLPNKFADENYRGAFYGIHYFANMQYYYDNYVYDPKLPGHKFNLTFLNNQTHLISSKVTGKFPKKVNQIDFNFLNDIYDNGVSQVDYEVGEIIKILKNNNLYNDTIIILQSEHGETLGERKYIAHTDIHDEMVHVPLIIHFPGVVPKIIEKNFVSGIDILPTILDLLNIKFNDYKFDGQSIVRVNKKKIETNITKEEVFHVRMPLWETTLTVDQKNSIFDQLREYQISIGHDFKEYAVRNNKNKLIHRRARFAEMQYSAWTFISGKRLNIPEFEFFDIVKDPKELFPIKNEGPVFNILKKRLLDFEIQVRTNGLKEIPKIELQDYR